MKKVSVIIPTHNTNQLSYVCFDSVINQTLSKNEYDIIIVLNGTKEPFFSDIKHYMEDKNVTNYKLVYDEWASISNARNVGLDIADTPYITFIDDDDYLSENFLEQTLLKADNHTMVVSDVWSFYNSTPDLRLKHYLSTCFAKNFNRKKKTLLRMRHYCSVCHASLIPKDVIGDKRFNTDFQNGEDCLFMADISNKIDHIDITAENTFYHKRIRENSLSNSFDSFFKITKNGFRVQGQFIKIYFSGHGYKLLFFLTRLLGVVKGITGRFIRKRYIIKKDFKDLSIEDGKPSIFL